MPVPPALMHACMHARIYLSTHPIDRPDADGSDRIGSEDGVFQRRVHSQFIFEFTGPDRAGPAPARPVAGRRTPSSQEK
jgi:hypothetical protein